MRLSLMSVGIVLVFFAIPIFTLAASTMYGQVVSVVPCPAPGGFLFSIGQPPAFVVFRPGATAAIPAGTVPRVGQTVFVGLGGTAACGAASAPLAVYFSSSTPPRVTAPSPQTGAGAAPLGAQVQSLIQQLLGQSKAPGSAGSGSPSPAAGAVGGSGASSGSLQYGGSITTPPIDCTCTNNYLLVVNGQAGPKSFLYTKGAPQKDAYSLPRGNVWTLFNYTPGGQCLVYTGDKCVPPPNVPSPTGTLTPNVGTSHTL